MTHRVAILVVDEFQLIDLAGPMDVFDTANRLRPEGPFYEVSVLSVGGGPLRSSSGLKILTERGHDYAGRIDSLIVTGSFPGRSALSEDNFVALCVALSARADRLVSVCNGAFGLAAGGLLEGHVVTTHWSQGEMLAESYPDVRVDLDRIFVQDGSLFTSGGATSGIDLALALVGQDLGVGLARAVAKWLVVFLRRPGGQSQFSAATAPTSAVSTPVEHALHLMHDDPAADHRVSSIARHVGLSRRHLGRVFKSETGHTVARYVESIRIEKAALLLESTQLNHEAIARQVGFTSGEAMRQVFQRERGISPSQQRAHFGAPTCPSSVGLVG